MVSFSCESCNDVLTKKKLDPHRAQCRHASFTCLDCMQHFSGTDYRGHTSCVSEAQKHQGALYRPDKEKKSRSKSSSVPKKAYVEDAPDAETGLVAILTNDAPPQAPSPPPAAPVNVFDFLVASDTPNASNTALPAPEPMKMVHDAPAVFEIANANASQETFGESRYGETGFHYGEGPVPTAQAVGHVYETPAPRRERDRGRRRDDDATRDRKKDNKRKRVHIDDLDLTSTRRRSGGDEIMTDAPPELHSGLTGGLNRLLSRPADYPPSPDYSGGDGADPSPGSPLKRSKHSRAEKGDSTALVTTRPSKSSSRDRDGVRVHKRHRKRRHRHHQDDDGSLERPARALKAIEYPVAENGHAVTTVNQLVVYRTRAELFMSFVNKGPDSAKGCSVNKALKRYHRERGDIGMGLGKAEEEKELWKTLRLRKNERGETVVFF